MIAYETGISPLDLLECPPEIFDALVAVREEVVKAQKKKGR